MTAGEFNQWLAYYSIDPWSQERADLRVAQLTAMFANVNAKKEAAASRPVDFMPWSEPAGPDKKSGQELYEMFQMMQTPEAK